MRLSASGLLLLAGLTGCFVQIPAKGGVQADGDSVVFTDMDQLFFDARQAIKQNHYDVAVQTCEKILHKDAKNMTALKIMGSAYYLMNAPERARHVWEYALQIDPNDPDIPEYLARLSRSGDN
jgi:Tfp pilus assembly protein PilF